MRARPGLAGALLKLGDDDAAISHFRDMLKLNPNDNQGIRYVLAGCLLRRGDEAALKELLAAYEDEGSAYLALYPRHRCLSPAADALPTLNRRRVDGAAPGRPDSRLQVSSQRKYDAA
jgi:tetratricopeptide (TPR) repeat protein